LPLSSAVVASDGPSNGLNLVIKNEINLDDGGSENAVEAIENPEGSNPTSSSFKPLLENSNEQDDDGLIVANNDADALEIEKAL
jgi:hypothetical protein